MAGESHREPSFSWSVELPERGSRGRSGTGRPRAVLLVSSEEHGEERLSIPVPVGRSLAELKKGTGAQPRWRTELLYELRERSRVCAAARAEALIARRDYSARELERKLAEDGYGEKVRSELVERYRGLGIIDDGRYATVFARSKIAQGWGPRRIEQELQRRGVDPRELEGWPDAFYEDESPEERAYRLASKRRVAERNGYEKLVRYLCGRGYSIAVATSVARRVVAEQREEEED